MPNGQAKSLLSPSALNSPRTSFQDYPLDTASQSGYSRRPSATTVPISELSSRRNSESTFANSAYNTPASAPLLGAQGTGRSIRNGESRSKKGTAWSDPREWRKATWVKILVWLTPIGLLLFVLLHHRSPLRPSLETVRKLQQQINSILHSSSYTCPSPLSARPTASFDDPTTFTRFESIKSNSTDFSLAISYSTTTCNSFRIRISRNNPAICLHNLNTPQRLNEDRDSTKWIANLGPDTFQLRVDGAERHVVDNPSHYNPERCEYYFDFPLANSGTVWLDGIHFYENYDTYNSNPRHDIERLLNPLFSTPLQLSLCGNKCTPYVPPLLAQPASIYPTPETAYGFDSPPAVLPICSGSAPFTGSYVPSAYPSLLYPPYQLPQTSSRPSAGYYTWVPSRCRISHDGLRFRGKHESCLREENKVLFIGDSHTRGLYDVILKRLNGSDEMALTSFKVANKWERIGNLDLEFLWDPFLEASFDCEYMAQFTHVVISTGSHQACYRCPTTESYISHMSSIFSSWPTQISRCSHSTRTRSKAVEFVFVTNPSWYPQKIERYDCRTQQRLTRWNELATEAALENDWSVVDAQEMTRSIAIDTRMIDGVHYIKTDAIDPMVDELLMKLKICGDEAGEKNKLESEDMLRR